mmetsp:Transcript_2835/g.3485  ORF Transcript_2835/g.3485 Transcript_2835/m.3485 type:complete len:414 (-) Transcript_2835:15-1256(-)|eukprot:CAMPEP_0168335738 /NCGR_PEP_ID=MMETSP0213-20121227/11101_1 /TAXON_ID=151035 /ORGANISM="Euplotes harpa, Strain FSP1.4" /LENGTH=413 /DNA_ID=CAMNT_0008340749 /DNA_START=82 /DNA_END=1323 /DNA_ORIENTATION=+
MEAASAAKRLIYHFDINKTILMKDTAKFDGSIEKVLLYLISSESWGLFDDAEGTWTLVSSKCNSEKPAPEDCDLMTVESTDMAKLITHKKWLLKKYPFIWSDQIQDYELRKIKHEENKLKREQLMCEFITNEQSVGWKLKDFYSELCRLCKYKDEPYSILPSFFRFYNDLAHKCKSEKPEVEFKIIFRTFGIDHKIIYDEFIQYLKGQHQIFKFDFPVDNPIKHVYGNCGNIFRSKEERTEIVLVSGMYPNKDLLENARETIFDKTLSKDETLSALKSYFTEKQFDLYNSELLDIHRGLKEINDFIMQNEDHFMILQDDYETWHYRDEKSNFAKPLIIDTQNLDKVVQIFFDDHCNPYEECIVNAIDLVTGDSIAYEDHIGKFSFKACPFSAIMNEDYFIEKVDEINKLSGKL